MKRKFIKTYWANEDAPYGSFDDFIIIESLINEEVFYMRSEEFDFLANKLFDNWQKSISKYIQILMEWNELRGFCDINEEPSIINDIDDTIEALQQIEGNTIEVYGEMIESDLLKLVDFLLRNSRYNIQIYKDGNTLLSSRESD